MEPAREQKLSCKKISRNPLINNPLVTTIHSIFPRYVQIRYVYNILTRVRHACNLEPYLPFDFRNFGFQEFSTRNDNIVQKQFLTFDNNTVIEDMVSVVHWLRTWKDLAKIKYNFKAYVL